MSSSAIDGISVREQDVVGAESAADRRPDGAMLDHISIAFRLVFDKRHAVFGNGPVKCATEGGSVARARKAEVVEPASHFEIQADRGTEQPFKRFAIKLAGLQQEGENPAAVVVEE